jgi:CRP/FNR family cyclic AMP-dependent transcriptional regulator
MEFLKMFSHWKDMEEHDAQTTIFSEGSPADVLYVIISGEVELSLRGESIGTEGVGGIIGEMAISQSATRNTTAKSLTDVKLARLNRFQLSELTGKNTEFSLHIMGVLADRLRTVNRYIKMQLGPV